MNIDLKSWLGQVTTGHAVMVIAPTLMAVASGQMTWTQAIPLLLAGAIGLIWPENTALKTATRNSATDIEALVAAYHAGASHGQGVSTAPGGVAGKTDTSVVAKSAPIASVLGAILLIVGAGAVLSACSSSGQLTPQAQQVIGALCKVDGVAQPIAVAVAPTLVPQSQGAVSIDNTVVHPLVVAACAQVGGTPTAVQVAPATSTPAAAAPVSAPAAPVTGPGAATASSH